MESNYSSETNHWLIAGYIKLKSLKIKQVIYIAKKIYSFKTYMVFKP